MQIRAALLVAGLASGALVAGFAGAGTAQSIAAPASARAFVVPGNVEWTNTGMRVTRGLRLRFESTGEIRLSFAADDVAHPGGTVTPRFIAKAPMPTVRAGALIGRVGTGRPFAVPATSQPLEMPADGRLYLGINDDHVPDNSGNFVVKVWEP